MKYVRVVITLALMVGLIYALDTKLGQAPPFGRFLNPFYGFWQNAESELAYRDIELPLEGLKDEVDVYFDDRLVPHIFAKNDEDLYYMQGYITARFRLWQMEVQTHNAAGRVSEIVGEAALEADKMQRRIGLEHGARIAEEYIRKDEGSRKLIEAYCNGINAYISTLKPKNYPVEYKLLNYQPERWEPVKVALLLKNMANMLSVFEWDIESSNFIATYGWDAYRQLYPDFTDKEDPIIPIGTKWDFDATAKADVGMKNLMAQTVVPETYRKALQKPDEITGSNNWAVHGSRTASGKPILCNDPHLKLSLPSIWYEMHLVSPSMNVYGATLPGSPAVIIGFNDSIAWGVTNAGRDVRDWYRIEFKDAYKNEYKFDSVYEPTTKKIEKYVVRGKGVVYDTVLYTRFGPIVFDDIAANPASKTNLALKWVAHLPSNEFKTFYQLNTGENYTDYISALNEYTCPAQNFVFASRSGDIAIKQQGRFSIRDKSTEQGKFPLTSTTANDWNAYIPAAANPHIKNPERGYVSSANQHPTDSTYPYYYPGVGVYENYRNRRINAILQTNDKVNPAFMMKMLSDNYNLHAAEALPVLLQLLPEQKLNEKEKAYRNVLQEWGYFNEAGQLAPVYFEIWWNELRKLLWDEMLNKELPMKQPNFYVTVQFLQNDSLSDFYDNKSTSVKETREDIVLQSFQRIKDSLASKQFIEVSEPYGEDENYKAPNGKTLDWGNYKSTRIEHLARLEPFSRLGVYNGGNLGIINATNQTNGPSWRMVVDLDGMKGYVVYPGGQSGNPGSRFYDDMVDRWAKGAFYEANFTNPKELKEKKLFKITAKPAAAN